MLHGVRRVFGRSGASGPSSDGIRISSSEFITASNTASAKGLDSPTAVPIAGRHPLHLTYDIDQASLIVGQP